MSFCWVSVFVVFRFLGVGGQGPNGNDFVRGPGAEVLAVVAPTDTVNGVKGLLVIGVFVFADTEQLIDALGNFNVLGKDRCHGPDLNAFVTAARRETRAIRVNVDAVNTSTCCVFVIFVFFLFVGEQWE